MTRLPEPSEHAPFYAPYIAAVAGDPLSATLSDQPDALARQLAGADPDSVYAPGKWTVSQAVQHVADTERVFAYRMLCALRGDAGPLPGFDENAWADRLDAGRSLTETLADARAVRAATQALAVGAPAAAWDRATVASGHRLTARAAAWIIAGHWAHHAAVLRDRYGLLG